MDEVRRVEGDAPDSGRVMPVGRVPSIDGLRGFALLGMMAWHAEVSWVKGGFARMTVFFVLAGYLACRSALRAAPSWAGGRFSVRDGAAFWARRAQRLIPVTAIGVLASVVAASVVGAPASPNATFWDSVATFTSWENWRLLATGQRYGALFESPSAFQHYWSLSVEEQCFIATPFVLALLAAATTDRIRRIRILAGVAALSCLLPLVWVQSPDAVYYGTHVRFGEFATGMVVALAFDGFGTGSVPRPVVAISRIVSPLGLAALVVVMLTISRDQAWIYRGGMGAMVIPVVGTLVGPITGERVTTSILGFRPLAWVGRAAFSIYVLHWPLFVVIDHLVGSDMTSSVISGLVVIAKFAAAFALGGALHRFYERPLMITPPTGAAPAVFGVSGRAWSLGIGMIALFGSALVVPTGNSIDFGAAQIAMESNADETSGRPGNPGSSGAQVNVFGGSSALMAGFGGATWAKRDPETRPFFGRGDAQLGCGLMDEGYLDNDPFSEPFDEDNVEAVAPACRDWPTRWSNSASGDSTFASAQPAIAVIVASGWDLHDRMDEVGGQRWSAGTSRYATEMASRLDTATETVVGLGAQFVVFTSFQRADGRWPTSQQAEFNRRSAAYEKLIRAAVDRANSRREAIGQRFVKAGVVDVGAWTEAMSADEFETIYPDGIHLTDQSGATAWESFIWPQMVGNGLAG